MTTYSSEAADAVLETIRQLVGSGQRAYSLNVPAEATKALVRAGGGSIKDVDASRMVRAAIAGLTNEGKLESPSEPFNDWIILQ
jgi:hypothetical protein